MQNLFLNIEYDIENDKYKFNSNAKEYRTIIENFLRSQIGAGQDNRKPVEKDIYNISIELDLSNDSFKSSDDCGNYGLRDGILMNALNFVKK